MEYDGESRLSKVKNASGKELVVQYDGIIKSSESNRPRIAKRLHLNMMEMTCFFCDTRRKKYINTDMIMVY